MLNTRDARVALGYRLAIVSCACYPLVLNNSKLTPRAGANHEPIVNWKDNNLNSQPGMIAK